MNTSTKNTCEFLTDKHLKKQKCRKSKFSTTNAKPWHTMHNKNSIFLIAIKTVKQLPGGKG